MEDSKTDTAPQMDVNSVNTDNLNPPSNELPKNKPYRIRQKIPDPIENSNSDWNIYTLNRKIFYLIFYIYIAYIIYSAIFKSGNKKSILGRIKDYKETLLAERSFLEPITHKHQVTIIYCETCKYGKTIKNVSIGLTNSMNNKLEDFYVHLIPYVKPIIYTYIGFLFIGFQIFFVLILIYMAEVIDWIESKTFIKIPITLKNVLMRISSNRLSIIMAFFFGGNTIKKYFTEYDFYNVYYGEELIWDFASHGSAATANKIKYLIDNIEGFSNF